jgi:hypothetical protein
MGGISSALDAQQKRLDAITHVCCSDQNYEVRDSGKIKVLVRHVRKEKPSKLSVRNWTKDPSKDSCAENNYCLQCDHRDTDEGQIFRNLLIPANRREKTTNSPRTWERKKSQNTFQDLDEASPPASSRSLKPPPGWSEADFNLLKHAVQVNAQTHRIKPPNYTETQVLTSLMQKENCSIVTFRSNAIISTSPSALLDPFLHQRMLHLVRGLVG